MVTVQKMMGLFFAAVFLLLVCTSSASAFLFNGTVKDVAGTALNNSVINITVRNTAGFTVVGYNTTTTNVSGWFNLTVDESGGVTWMYDISILHMNGSSVAFVGQNMPAFPSDVLGLLGGITFYLQPAGTLNLTAINGSSEARAFQYQIKDTKLGYPVAQNFDGFVTSAVISLPRNRNYSIMIYPNQSMPISYSWSNFSSQSDYTIGINGNSNYNQATHQLNKAFNTTLRLDRVSGYVNFTGIAGWNELHIVPFILEPGNMVHAVYGDMPYNLSSAVGSSDFYNTTSGFYNISLPATAEVSEVLLFASVRNGSDYYGAFRNITFSYNDAPTEKTGFNFSLSGLLGNSSNISLDRLDGQPTINISAAKQTFNLLNTSNNSMTNIFSHIETTVDYSAFGPVKEFTWMIEIDQGAAANFQLPLLNITGVKEMNLFVSGGGDDAGAPAPKMLSRTAGEIKVDNNIIIKNFDPGNINDNLGASAISITLITSNTTCDVPSPDAGCYVSSTDQSMAEFEPMGAVLGGGKLSFIMGTGSVKIHYVNVDLLASGPPDALFDDSTTSASSGNDFGALMRFGSQGPTIYDYVMVGIPYSEAAGGLVDSAQVNLSVPLLYDDNWNVVWNATANGTNATQLGANLTHYAGRSAEWAELLVSRPCVTNISQFNYTNPCYINTSNNVIWVRLPHFSGTGPLVDGSKVASTTTTTTTTTSSSDSGSGPPGVTGGAILSTSEYIKGVWTSVNPGETASVAAKDDTIGITAVEFTVKEIVYGAWIKVSKPEALPKTIEMPAGKTYSFIQVSKSNTLKEELIEKATISFKVEKKWLADNGLTADEVALSRYSGGVWNELKTTVGEDDGTSVSMSAETPGFSYFAIAEKVGDEAAEASAEEVPDTEIQQPPAALPPEAVKTMSIWLIVFLVGGAAILVILVIFVMVRMGKKGKHKN